MWARQVLAAWASPATMRSRCELWGMKVHLGLEYREKERHQGNMRRYRLATHVTTHLTYNKFMT